MNAMMETCIIVALSFAVFSAVATVGASLALGIGFERLRAGFDVIRKQTGYFSDQIYQLDKRVETLEKDDHPATAQDAMAAPKAKTEDIGQGQIQGMAFDQPAAAGQRLLLEGDFRPASRLEGIRFH